MSDPNPVPVTTDAITTPIEDDIAGEATFTDDAPDKTDDQAGGTL